MSGQVFAKPFRSVRVEKPFSLPFSLLFARGQLWLELAVQDCL